jgi:DNA-binding SARP family transcriptional activator
VNLKLETVRSGLSTGARADPALAASPRPHSLAPVRLRVGSAVTLERTGRKAWELKGKAAVVLAWVALEGHVEKRRLASVLWPLSDVGQARSNLRVLAHRINLRAGCELLVGVAHLQLDAALVRLELNDSNAVLSALRSAGAQRCELLAEAGVEAEAGEELQAWLREARQRSKQMQLAGLAEALAQAVAGGRHELAVALARACVELDPLSEHRHRQLMDVLVRGGDRAAALAAYEECKTQLRQHLGVLPDLQTRTVQLRVLQEQAQTPQQGAGQRAERSPEADGLTALGGAARYPLVEREAVLAQVQAALNQGTHVVVQGEPGVGKTRLLRHVAAAVGGGVEAVAIRAWLKQEPYAAVAQLLQEVQHRRAPRIDVPQQIELARLAPLAFAAVKPSEAALSAARLHAALRHWVARLGEAGVRVLVLDDVQYADSASQAALAALLEAEPELAAVAQAHETPDVSSRPALLLLGHRSCEVEPVLEGAVAQLQARQRVRRIELERLTLVGALALLKAMDAAHRTDAPDALAAQLLKRTGGNPLFLIELAHQALEHGQAADIASPQALLGSRLKGCSVAAQQLAAVAAVAAQDFTVELAAAVTGQPALALMPAWGELQQKGLFAGHGLAHDLVQVAVLAGLPQAIRQLLHRQVAQHLEGQGRQGAAVLRHWLAADDCDRALPHAVHQLHVVGVSGLPTAQQELEMLGLLERAGDAVLMDNLWLTAEIDGAGMGDGDSTQMWQRLRELRQRVERLPRQGTSAVWVAFETSRDHFYIERSVKDAYDVLAPMVDQLPQTGVERARAERELALYAFQLTGSPREHLRRASTALEGLAEHLSLVRVRRTINGVAAIFLNPVVGIRSQAARRRAGTRRGDLALVADANSRMAYIHSALGNHAHSLRHYCRAARAQPGDGLGQFQSPVVTGAVALSAGRFDLAQRLLHTGADSMAPEQAPLFLALLHLRLGDMQQAGTYAGCVSAELLRRHFMGRFIQAHVCAELDRSEGRDPVPALRRQLEQIRELGMSGINLDLMAWEITLRTHSAAERLTAGEALLSALRASNAPGGRLVRVLLDVAEARAETGVPGSAELAGEAARLLRRGCTTFVLYVPEGLVRCARLLRAGHPREAAALVHVARHWVQHALAHAPQGSQERFVHNVVVNRLLLGDDEHAVYAGPWR